jgi:hypothetical protein
MASVRERTIPTERPPPVSEGSSANCNNNNNNNNRHHHYSLSSLIDPRPEDVEEGVHTVFFPHRNSDHILSLPCGSIITFSYNFRNLALINQYPIKQC